MFHSTKVENIIKDTLQKRGINHDEMCMKLGIKKINFVKSMTGKRKLKSSEFISICIFLNLNAEDFKKCLIK